MEIKELITKLFGDAPQTESTVIDNWRTYYLEPGYVTTMRLEELYKQFALYGQSNKGEKLIISGECYVLIKHPPVERRKDKIELCVREDNLRPAFLNDMSEETDFENNRIKPKIAYGYVWRSQNLEAVKAWRAQIEDLDALKVFIDYEADVKSWTLIESTMLNKQDTIPQIRNSFKPYIKVETERGLLLNFPSGFVAFDEYGHITIAMDYRIATGILDIITMATNGDEEAIEKLIAKLRTEILNFEGSYFVFEETNLETALLSSIGNSI
jgi:hypothetical protein